VNTRVEEKSDTQVLLHVEVPVDIVDQKMKELFQEVARTIDVPGFRRGKVPRVYMEQRFGTDFLDEDAQGQLIEEYGPMAILENSIEPATRPEPKIIIFELGKPFEFEMEIEIFPAIELPDEIKLNVEAPSKHEITSDMVDEAIENIKVDHATLVPKSEGEASEADDIVVIKDGEGRTQEIQARNESWMENLIGVKAGDQIKLNPSEAESVKVTIDAVKKIELPDLDDLAKTLGHDDADTLSKEIEKRMDERSKQDHEQAVQLAVLDQLLNDVPVIIPEGITDQLLEQDLEMYKKSGGAEPSDEDKVKIRESIEQRVKRERMMQAVKEKEGIEYSDEDFEEFISSEAESRDTNPVKFKAVLEREGQLQRIRNDQETQIVMKLLVEKSTIKHIAPSSPDEEEAEQEE
jgi:trigger factor